MPLDNVNVFSLPEIESLQPAQQFLQRCILFVQGMQEQQDVIKEFIQTLRTDFPDLPRADIITIIEHLGLFFRGF
jgi:hypothetical protein